MKSTTTFLSSRRKPGPSALRRWIPAFAGMTALVGLAACDSIGEGSTIEKLELVVAPVDTFEQGTFLDRDTPDERYRMYDCFCSNLAVLATFTDGTLSNFSNRATFTSDAPGIVTVLNLGESDATACPLAQQGAGLLIPKGLGTATITVAFASLRDTLKIEVADAAAGSYVLAAAPPATENAVAVGAQLRLQLTAMLDGRPRTLDPRSVLTWSFDNANDDVATIDAIGVVQAVAPSGAAPMIARAAFGTCTGVSPTASIDVGDVLGPLTLEREAPDFATDGMLAVNSNEFLTVGAPLDFDGDDIADGSQLIGSLIRLSYTDSCTLREYDETVPTTNCRDTPTTCADTVPTCAAATETLCESTMTACRTEASPLVPNPNNQIRAVSDNGGDTRFTATFPVSGSTATTLAAAVDDQAASTSIEVTALSGYPTTFPWYAVIDEEGVREDVRVTAADSTTLTVVRGISGTAPAAHASGASFAQRLYRSDANDPLVIRAKDGTLTTVTVDPPGTLQALGTLQLAARGTFVDELAASREQRVTRLIAPITGGPQVNWFSSDSSVAVVTFNGGLALSTGACGGTVSVRARATTSTDDTTGSFDSTTTADDTACENTDPLCDQIELCVETPSPPPLGTTCDAITTCP